MVKNQGIAKDVDFIFEMGNIRHISRMWNRFMGVNFANLADHHFRTYWIAMIIASYEKKADINKVAKLAMIHDVAESRTGDVDYLARQYVIRHEELGIKDILEGTILEKDFVKLWREAEKKQTLEAQIVKDADNLDVDFELAEQSVNGNLLRKVWRSNRKHVRDTKLYTKTAKLIAKELESADPHSWHMNTRNRRNAGDWKN